MGSSEKTFDSINPATGALLTSVAACDAADVDAAVGAARAAFESGSWSQRSPGSRKKVLLRLAELIMENREEIALLDSLDMGKPVRDAYAIDVPAAARIIGWYGECVDKIYDQIAPTPQSVLALITREPVGVGGAVIPWNFPLSLASWKLGPALAAGNSVVLKPAEQSPLSALRLAELAMEAGLPEGVLNVVPGFGETAGAAIGRHDDIDCVTFTGSTEVGKLFLRYAGESNMKQVWLECGGKSPNLVFADCADLDRAAKFAAFGIFFNQGEVCSASSRLLVEHTIKEEFLEQVVERARALQPGDPLDPNTRLGAMVDEVQTQRVVDFIAAGKSEGATLKVGGQRTRINGGGSFIEPTVFDAVTNDMRIAQEEIFGPVLSVLTFEDEKEAIGIANGTIYGLAAAVWTHNLTRAHRLARRLRAGTVAINTVDAIDVTTPFGGFKQSGVGRDLSMHALDKFAHLKTTWIHLGRD